MLKLNKNLGKKVVVSLKNNKSFSGTLLKTKNGYYAFLELIEGKKFYFLKNYIKEIRVL